MNLTVGITQAGQIDISKVDQLGINIELRKFKNEDGSVKFTELFNIPVAQRIHEMSKRDFGNTVRLVAVALTLCFEKMNLSRKMTDIQVVDLAEEIVESSWERDKISLEDLMIFLQKLSRGEYAELYEGIDHLKFFSRFDKFRDERWEAGIKLRDEKDEEYKKLGDDNLYERTFIKDASPFGQMMEQYRTKTQIRRDEERESKRYEQ